MTLIVQQLTHRYGDVDALRGVDVKAAPARITAVLGPNASGKSTLLRCIIGAIKPTAGVVLIDGTPAHAMSAYHLARKIAYVPQRSVVSASFTVREVVELGRYALPASRSRIDAALARMELIDIAGRPYEALSVGQQQRVTLARALAQLEPPQSGEARYLILDEPTSGMDLRHIHDIMDVLHDLSEQGVTILITMHDVSMAASVTDDAWLLDGGRLVAAGSAGDVLDVEQLGAVFEVDFERVRSSSGAAALLAVQRCRCRGEVDVERTIE